jgi:hypothetical protein
MKSKATMAMTAVLVLAALAIPPVADAYRVPAITEGIAEEFTGRLLRRLPGWRYRQYGYNDCGGGRISRTEWSCRVGWVYGRGCRRGRVRVNGEYIENGVKFYSSHMSWTAGC